MVVLSTLNLLAILGIIIPELNNDIASKHSFSVSLKCFL
jgi:hypothetical protein